MRKNPSDAYLKIPLDLRWMCEVTSNFNIHELNFGHLNLAWTNRMNLCRETNEKEKMIEIFGIAIVKRKYNQ